MKVTLEVLGGLRTLRILFIIGVSMRNGIDSAEDLDYWITRNVVSISHCIDYLIHLQPNNNNNNNNNIILGATVN